MAVRGKVVRKHRPVQGVLGEARQASDATQEEPHACHFIEEQQTHHRFCVMCGRHDPPQPERCPDRPSGLWVMLRDPHWRDGIDDLVT